MFLAVLALASQGLAVDSTAVLPPAGLICELMVHPENAVITDPCPEFCWVVNSPLRNVLQSGYQIIVASRKQFILNGRGDMWDSGKVGSAQSINVEYNGRSLEPNSSFWWAVRVWNAKGCTSPYSKPQRFNTGDFFIKRSWPGESRWVSLKDDRQQRLVFENRHPTEYHEIAPARFVRKDTRLGEAPSRSRRGHYFVDFGRAAFATIRLTLTSRADDNCSPEPVQIHLGEKLSFTDTVDRKPGGKILYKTVSLNPRRGTHTYTIELPRHKPNYPHSDTVPEHMPEVAPFRYAEIINCPSQLKASDIHQLALFYHFDDNASTFSSSDEVLNKVWNLCKYTLKATTFLGNYADGNRERMMYEADCYIQQLGHYCVDREYVIARYSHENLIFHPTWPTEWIMHSVFMAWADYLYTGNAESMEKYYADLKAKTLLALARRDGLISTRTGLVTKNVLSSIHFEGQLRDIVDWPPASFAADSNGPGERDGYVFTNINTVVNAFHYRALVLTSRIAAALNKTEDSGYFDSRAKLVKKSINEKLFDKKRGIYVDGEGTKHVSLHANMFCLAFGLVPQQYKQSVVDFVKTRGMACSVYGAQYLLEALYEAGEDEYALELMTSKTDRSWWHMIELGSTMTLEAWDMKYKRNLDWNHAWGAAPANIIPRFLMGVKPLEPGFGKIQIKPQVGGLKNASLDLPTIRGTVHVDFELAENASFVLNICIPANTIATVYIPAGKAGDVTEGGKPADKAEGVKFLRMQADAAVYMVGSGTYAFVSN
jgi:hypothetical protein